MKPPATVSACPWERRLSAGIWLSLPALFLSACHPGHRQSALHTAAEASGEIARLWWAMFIVLTASFVLVMALTWIAIRRRLRADDSATATVRWQNRFVIFGGIAFPTAVLTWMLLDSLGTSRALRQPPEGLRIEVVGYQWWWDVRYPEHDLAIANEIYLPVGEPVVIELGSADVIHSFWVPNLHGKVDMIPEFPTRIVLRADRPGRWRGQCAEFCGRQHAWMAFEVVALPREKFDAWLAERAAARAALVADAAPATPEIARGRDVFFRESCHTCHPVHGTPADSLIGPDLTHLGTRLTLGAGRIANTNENLARWILDPQGLKPGNLMPGTPLDERDLADLVAYLRSLR